MFLEDYNRDKSFAATLFFGFTTIDILFLPYLSFFATTMSQLVLIFWFVMSRDIVYISKLIKSSIFIFVLLVVASLGYSFMHTGGGVRIENMKWAGQIILSLLFLIYFYDFQYTFNKSLKNVIRIFMLYMVLWGIIYQFDFHLFIKIKSFFNPFDSFLSILSSDPYYLYRFNFIWADPNNVGYMIVSILLFAMGYCRLGIWELIGMLLASAYLLTLIMSTGSFICFFVFTPLGLYFYLKEWLKNKKVNWKIWIPTIVVGVLLSGVLLFHIFMSSSIYEIAKSRIVNSAGTSGGYRSYIFFELINNKPISDYLLLGKGYLVYLKDRVVAPHNGHLLLIYAYGYLAYMLFMIIHFQPLLKIKQYLFLFPFLLCFTINIGITEIKYYGIMVLLLATAIAYNRNKND